MKARFRWMVVALLAVFAVCAVAATAASAKNPTWMTCKAVTAGTGKFEDGLCSKGGKGNWEASELLTGESKEIRSEANGGQEFYIESDVINCHKLKTKPGAEIVGGEPGSGEEVIVYEECYVPGRPDCKINEKSSGTITTNTLTSTLVYLTKEAAEKESAEAAGTLLKPKTGTVLATLHMSENAPEDECAPILKGEVQIKGEVIADNVKGGAHATKHELSIPIEEEAQREYWLQEGKTIQKKATNRITWNSLAGTWAGGKSFVTMASAEAFWIP
jgi:hypothetical protein